MQIIDLDAATLTRHLGTPVSELEVAIAKNLVLGIPAESLKDILGPDCTAEQIEELKQDAQFKQVYGFIAQYVMKQNAETSLSWDKLENLALTNLVRAVRVSQDPDLNLRVAAVANRAVRRHHNKGDVPLDPAMGGQRVMISLTERFIQKLSGRDNEERTRERTIKLTGVRNPSFDELGGIFNPVAADGTATSPAAFLSKLAKD